MNAERPADGANDIHPAPLPHPFATNSGSVGPSGFPGGPVDGNPYAWPPTTFHTPPPQPPKRRRWLFYTAWIAGGALLVGLVVQAGVFVSDLVTEAVTDVDFFAEPTGTVLSDSWEVDGVEVAYVEAGGTPCDSEFCWEWLLMTEPDCATATVTIEISESMWGEPQRQIEQSVTIESVTSVLVDAAADDGEFADLVAISCGEPDPSPAEA